MASERRASNGRQVAQETQCQETWEDAEGETCRQAAQETQCQETWEVAEGETCRQAREARRAPPWFHPLTQTNGTSRCRIAVEGSARTKTKAYSSSSRRGYQ